MLSYNNKNVCNILKNKYIIIYFDKNECSIKIMFLIKIVYKKSKSKINNLKV